MKVLGFQGDSNAPHQASDITAANLEMLADTKQNLRLMIAENIDMKSAASTALGTVPSTWSVFVPMLLCVHLTAGTGGVTAATISVGSNSPNNNNILGLTLLTSILATNHVLNIPIASQSNSIAGGATINFRVTTPAVATTQVARVLLLGYGVYSG